MEVNLHKSMALDLYDGLSKLKDNEIPVHARSQLWSCARNDPRLGLARSSSCLPVAPRAKEEKEAQAKVNTGDAEPQEEPEMTPDDGVNSEPLLCYVVVDNTLYHVENSCYGIK